MSGLRSAIRRASSGSKMGIPWASIVRASAPQSAGRKVCKDVRILGVCPAPVAGAADITGLYTARFGLPAAGTKVFVLVNQFVDGYEDLGTEFAAVVPAGP